MAKKKGISDKRFIDNKDGTTTDKSTSLIWVKDPSQLGGVFGTSGDPSRMDYPHAVKACKGLKYAGRKGWRLPIIKELISIIDYKKYDPAIDMKFFVSQPNWYWSSTNHARWSGNAWVVNFYNGYVNYNGEDGNNYVRPVRSSQ